MAITRSQWQLLQFSRFDKAHRARLRHRLLQKKRGSHLISRSTKKSSIDDV